MSFERLFLKFLLVVQSNYANKLAVVKCIKCFCVLSLKYGLGANFSFEFCDLF